jgi:hypothetical protein
MRFGRSVRRLPGHEVIPLNPPCPRFVDERKVVDERKGIAEMWHAQRAAIMFWSLLVLSVVIVIVLIAKSALTYILQQRAAKRGTQ